MERFPRSHGCDCDAFSFVIRRCLSFASHVTCFYSPIIVLVSQPNWTTMRRVWPSLPLPLPHRLRHCSCRLWRSLPPSKRRYVIVWQYCLVPFCDVQDRLVSPRPWPREWPLHHNTSLIYVHPHLQTEPGFRCHETTHQSSMGICEGSTHVQFWLYSRGVGFLWDPWWE